MISKAIFGLLSAQSSLTDICAQRIYPLLAPQEAELPFVVFTVVTTVPSDTKDGVSTVDFVRVQVDSYSANFDESWAMDEAVRTAMDKKNVTVNGLFIDGSKFETKSNFFEEDGEAFRTMSEYTLRWKKT